MIWSTLGMTQLATSIASFFDMVPVPLPISLNVNHADGSFDSEFVGLPTSCDLARSILSRAKSATLSLSLVQMIYQALNTAAPILDYPMPEPKLIVDHFLTLYTVSFNDVPFQVFH
jgi:hypothetical protein